VTSAVNLEAEHDAFIDALNGYANSPFFSYREWLAACPSLVQLIDRLTPFLAAAEVLAPVAKRARWNVAVGREPHLVICTHRSTNDQFHLYYNPDGDPDNRWTWTVKRPGQRTSAKRDAATARQAFRDARRCLYGE